MVTGAPHDTTLKSWLVDQTRATAALDTVEGGSEFARFAASLPCESDDGLYPISPAARFNLMRQLKFKHPLGPKYFCAELSAKLRGPPRLASVYALLFWRLDSEGEPETAPEYIAIGSTFDSRDGEYRASMISYSDFAAAAELIPGPAEQTILDAVAESRLVLDLQAFPASFGPAAAEFGDAARVQISALASAAAIESVRFRQPHARPEYYDVLAELGLARQWSPEDSKKYIMRLLPRQAICGVKLVPMTLREVLQPNDPNMAAWRELMATNLAGDLTLNLISPAFAFYNQWSAIDGGGEGLFENPGPRARYRRALVTSASVASLREARARLTSEPELVNAQTEEMRSILYEGVEYAQSHLLMADYVLMHTMQHVGHSLGAHPQYAADPAKVAMYPRFAGAWHNRDSAARCVFELVYGAHCLHSRLGIAHTDLHVNNITMYRWAGSTKHGYDDPVVLYVAGPRGAADAYVFPAAGVSATIIDFSRAVLGPACRPALEAGRGAQFADNFYRDQVARAVRALHRYAPSFVEKNEARLTAAFIADFESAFPVLCAVDFVAVGRSVAAAARADPAADPVAGALAAAIERAALEALLAGLRDLVAGGRRAASFAGEAAAGRPFPGAALIPRLFAEWGFAAFKRARTAQLVDAYNYGNPLRYSASDYSRFPPWARIDDLEQHLGTASLEAVLGRAADAFLDALRAPPPLAAEAERLRAEQDALDGLASGAASSSWAE